MAKKSYPKTIYRVVDDTFTGVYRFVVYRHDRRDESQKVSRTEERTVPNNEYSLDHAGYAFLFGIPITKEQYDNYDPKLGIIACGLIENHKNDIHYNDEYFAKERAKGIKLGY